MAGVSSDNGGDNLSVELNLVPFIDLLSSLVLFLLVTAVWLQVGTIPASVESKGKSRVSLTEQNRVMIHMTSKGVQLTWPGNYAGKNRLPRQLPLDGPKLLDTLTIAAKDLASSVVAVTSDDLVEYGMVVQAIDMAKKAGFTTVALGTN
jgi:biopolymer transport protein TolR